VSKPHDTMLPAPYNCSYPQKNRSVGRPDYQQSHDGFRIYQTGDGFMLRSNKDKQFSYEFVCIEDYVPEDHLLRKIDRFIDFSFITEKVKPYYCEDKEGSERRERN
jgi:hypothetical protein